MIKMAQYINRIFWGITLIKNIYTKILMYLKGQSHEKVDEISVWGVSQGPN
jgi:hypothetical protein